MNFQKITPVESAKFYLDLSFRKAREKAKEKTYPRDPIKKIKLKETIKVDVVKDVLTTKFQKILTEFPGTIELPDFYQDLIKLTLDYKKLKKSFGAVNWAITQIKTITSKHVREIAKSPKEAKSISKRHYGRISSVVNQIKSNLLYLEESRKIFRTYPDIKELPTICLYGFPNVGKSTLLNKLTGSKAKIAAYSFTTKSINSGFFKENGEKIQVLDVPGTLARKEKMNNIEKQAELVVERLADIIIYVFDLTERCGHSIKDQEELYKKVSKKKKTHIYLSKQDLLSKEEIAEFPLKSLSLEEIKHIF